MLTRVFNTDPKSVVAYVFLEKLFTHISKINNENVVLEKNSDINEKFLKYVRTDQTTKRDGQLKNNL